MYSFVPASVCVSILIHCRTHSMYHCVWLVLLILSTAPPVVIVVIAAPIAHPYYGSELGWDCVCDGMWWHSGCSPVLNQLYSYFYVCIDANSSFNFGTYSLSATCRCWLSPQNGTHWAFFVPAILVALVSIFRPLLSIAICWPAAADALHIVHMLNHMLCQGQAFVSMHTVHTMHICMYVRTCLHT